MAQNLDEPRLTKRAQVQNRAKPDTRFERKVGNETNRAAHYLTLARDVRQIIDVRGPGLSDHYAEHTLYSRAHRGNEVRTKTVGADTPAHAVRVGLDRERRLVGRRWRTE